jgi:site-specific DNA-methyltransferase (adenine-specific)
LALLERIISAGSDAGEVVLDPFCGCGTAVDASQKLGRKWIGIDITHLAVSLIEKRMKDRYPGIKFEVHGTPKDLAGAIDLAERDKYQFQWWACSLVDAQPFGGKKKGADGGIDGLIYFGDIAGGKEVTQKAVVSVKGGNTNVSHIRDLKGVMERDKAAIGLFVTLEKPSKPMLKEAADAGEFKAGNGKLYPRLQVLSIEDLFDGKRAQMPDMAMGTLTFKKAVPHKAKGNEAPSLFGDEG